MRSPRPCRIYRFHCLARGTRFSRDGHSGCHCDRRGLCAQHSTGRPAEDVFIGDPAEPDLGTPLRHRRVRSRFLQPYPLGRPHLAPGERGIGGSRRQCRHGVGDRRDAGSEHTESQYGGRTARRSGSTLAVCRILACVERHRRLLRFPRGRPSVLARRGAGTGPGRFAQRNAGSTSSAKSRMSSVSGKSAKTS